MLTPRDQSITLRSLLPSKRYFFIVFLAITLFFVFEGLRFTPSKYDDEMFQKRFGPWAVVAGASEGLGAAWAVELADKGLNVVLMSRSEKKLLNVRDTIKSRRADVDVKIYVQDLADPDLETKFRDFTKELDVGLLIYNAAYVPRGAFLSSDVSKAMTAIDVNIGGPTTLTHVVTSRMTEKNRPGGVVVMSSMAGLLGTGHVAAYSASKSWNTAFAHALWYEMQEHRIDVLSCIAGPTRTPSYLKFAGDRDMMNFIEQDSDEVVQECTNALGQTPSLATGTLNKLTRFLFTRLVPVKAAIKVFSDETVRLGNLNSNNN